MSEKIALITGASRGLGAALAETLSTHHHIVAIARTTGALEALDDRIQTAGGSATLASVDITNQDALAQICRSIFDRWGHVDLWCHTAVHAAPLGPAATLDSKDWSKSIATNLTATGILIPFIAPLLGQEGRAIFFDDQNIGNKFYGAYGATKTAQITLARSWAKEQKTSGPRVDIVAPHPMSTATRAKFHPGESQERLADPLSEAQRLLTELNLIQT